MKIPTSMLLSLGLLALACGHTADVRGAVDPANLVVVCGRDGGARIRLAAAELRRYVYLRTGRLCDIAQAAKAGRDQVVLARAGNLAAEQFTIRTDTRAGHQRVTITGGSDLGVLYGAYRYVEKLGVRFYLHGDAIPDERIAALPEVNEDAKPLFDIRGILPFHDFFEGPDWWNLDDYKAYAVQMARMRLNFIGLHNYPERQQGYPGPEPSVWIGLPDDADSQGVVTYSYPGFFANTLRPGWGNVPMQTSQYVGGAAELFEYEGYGPDPQIGYCPWPTEPADCNTVFNRTAAMYREAFTLARGLGIKTCLGTETPLTVPQRVQERIKSRGKDPADPAVVRQLYEGVFRRISRAFPADYYWLWTPEDWTWGGNKPGQFEATAGDVQAALGALEKLGHPLTLATCGWVLGPQHDRAALDKLLPKNSPVSCINQKVGHAPVESSFERIQGRPKWAIPWLENDPNMTGPQPWVGRMFYDGADALRYGCTGLLGIHWRTKVIGMNIAALAQAGWAIPKGLREYEADGVAAGSDGAGEDRALGADAFYQDWAVANFGRDAGPAIAALFTRLDGKAFPEVSQWGSGPGRVKVNGTPWAQEAKRFAFVDEAQSLRSRVQGAGNLERFDYWLNTFRFTRAMAQFSCAAGELDRLMKGPVIDKERALAMRGELAQLWTAMIRLQVAAVDTPGELGTLANLEQQSRGAARLLTKHDVALKKLLGTPDLPAACQPATTYAGPARLILPTVRTIVAPGEALALKIIALDAQPVTSLVVRVRPLGKGDWRSIPVAHAARAVYRASLPAAQADFEYYVTARTAVGATLTWPATAPQLNQSVIVAEVATDWPAPRHTSGVDPAPGKPQ